MTEISIDEALERIESSKQRERRDGLSDLKHILTQNRRNQKLQDISDRGYHAIFEVLFRLVQNEKANFSKSAKSGRAQASSILSTCASVVRLAVELGVTRIRHKTLRAIIDHFIETLPDASGQYCEPIETDYLRAIRATLEYQAHANHLSGQQWLRLVEFCNEGLQLYASSTGGLNSTGVAVSIRPDRSNDMQSRSTTPVSLNSSFTAVRKSVSSSYAPNTSARSRQVADELVACLYRLFSVAHARVLEVARDSLGILVEFLRSTPLLGRPQGQQHAFGCINIILATSSTENLVLSLAVFRESMLQIRRLWQPKTHNGLKNEMLVTLTLGEPLLNRMIQQDDWETTKNDIEALMETLRTEYSKRAEKEFLQLDEIGLGNEPSFMSNSPLAYQNLRLKTRSIRSEQIWMLLRFVARTFAFLHLKEEIHSLGLHGSVGDDDGFPRKRQKIHDPTHEIIDAMLSAHGPEKLAHLHILTFIVGEVTLNVENIQFLCNCIVPLVSNETSSISAWSMLVLSSVACRSTPDKSTEIRDTWLQVWRLTSRKITNPLTCRPACHLMAVLLEQDLIEFSDISDIVEAMLSSIELNGPVNFNDCASSLWRCLIPLRGRHSPSLIYNTSERLIRWLFLRWRPSQVEPRTSDLPNSHSFGPHNIIDLTASLLGLPWCSIVNPSSPGLGIVALAAERVCRNERLTDYLLLVDKKKPQPRQTPKSTPSQMHITLSDAPFQRLCALVIDLLHIEITILLSLISNAEHLFRVMQPDTVTGITALCLLSFSLLSTQKLRQTPKLLSLRNDTENLRDNLSRLILLNTDPVTACDGFLLFGSLLEFKSSPSTVKDSHAPKDAAQLMARGYGLDFWQRLREIEHNSKGGPDLMDIDCDLGSQDQPRKGTATDDMTRNWLGSLTDHQSRRATLSLRICWASFSTPKIATDTETPFHIPFEFVEHLTHTQPSEFFSFRWFLREMFDSNQSISAESATKLLEYLGQEVLQVYEFERCEVAMGTCLDIMTNLSARWTVSEDEMSDLSLQLYQWFIEVVIDKHIASPHVHICIARMLQCVIETQPEYGKTLSLPSAKTSLFKILEEGHLVVKFEIGLNISDVFRVFILKEHDAILDDVLAHFPIELDWIEGTALRMFVLGHLGSSWSTLIRRCIYALVEASGLVPTSLSYAKYCIDRLSAELALPNSRDLFRLFASQILYTWLDTRSLDSVPFGIFGYNNLTELIRDVEHEVTAQVIMRGRYSEVQQLSDSLSEPFNLLLQNSFGRSIAYVVARDAAIPPEADPPAAGGAARLRNAIGKETYASLIGERFPEIIATLFKIVDREDTVVKGFQKSEAHARANVIYHEILSLGTSSSTLAVSQQPSFKATCLVDEIDYVCSRSPYDVESIWTPALYIYIFRELMNTIRPALGSLHTAAVVRRIRILISVTGDTALTFYPLEMALHAMKPLLTNAYCAEDAMGIFQYLLMHGSSSLLEVPRFLTGLAVSTIISLRSFLDSPQESTTQESHYQKTLSKAKEFHAWLGEFINENHTDIGSDDAQKFDGKMLVRLSMRLRGPGNALKGTFESALLADLLNDEVSGSNLIEESYRDAIIGMLCADFELPPSPREDVISTGEEALRKASVVWKFHTRKNRGQGYTLWVARILGRAYATSGFVDPDIIREINLDATSRSRSAAFRYLVSESRSAIINRLRELLLSERAQEVGLAERALQAIATKAEADVTLTECIDELPQSVLPSLSWKPFSPPVLQDHSGKPEKLSDALVINPETTLHSWTQKASLALLKLSTDGTLRELPQVLLSAEHLSETLFPYILHILLLDEFEGRQRVREVVSRSVTDAFKTFGAEQSPLVMQIIRTILYLRSQPVPRERSKADRSYWLEIDYRLAAEVATKCNMFKTALLFLEINLSELKAKGTRRSSVQKSDTPSQLLLDIFRNLEDKDFFYGVQQAPSLSAIMSQLEFEDAGFKSLSFRGAHYDSQIRQGGVIDPDNEDGIIKLLDALDLNGLSQSMLSSMTSTGHEATEAMFQTARKLERWDLSTPDVLPNTSTTIFRVFQNVHDASLKEEIRSALDTGYASTIGLLGDGSAAASTVHSILSTLAILTEVEEVLDSQSFEELQDTWNNMQTRDEWMLAESFDHIRDILSCRRTIFSVLSKSENLRNLTNVSKSQARELEVKVLLASSSLARRHGALQNCLDIATFLGGLVVPCAELGLSIDASAQFEASSVLWEQGEMASSIRMLHEMLVSADLSAQAIKLGRPELLVKLGHRISEARLEKPDQVLANYLEPAIKGLRDLKTGSEAGQVFHEFAAFCDKQLQKSDNIEDMRRVENLRNRKEAEVTDLDKMLAISSSKPKEKDTLKILRAKAKQWFELDDREFQRLKESRQALLRQSLENYLLCLCACDDYENDALRFSALWLEHSENDAANEAVAKHIKDVPSRKFATLMNQWTSRLLELPNQFQSLLSSLVLRICEEHPYHGMYHIFASSSSKGGKDQKALSRNGAAKAIVAHLKEGKYTAHTWIAIHNTNINFVRFAAEKPDDGTMKLGSKIPLRKSRYGVKLEHDADSLRIPPPTMKIDLRPNCDYSKVPYIVKYQSEFTIASGVSMPKILTAIASNGRKYKQLLKSGNDDLRQDSIMEQVFEQVSNLLKTQRDTRRRSLGIRTYKVLPLTATAGIIEFVSNTIPLHDYLLPAHKRHFPNDLKPTACREAIQKVQSSPNEFRIKVFRQVCEKFSPVLRYFFMERFENPDDWFARRLAYTRSTATISILGHILGLGDRHGHNILLDEETGEVVHIDLGIAFEQGRVLPVPELVPFRLTRDIVDGMGITKTEGVFRRCCEFTLDALRQESYSIMTILDVLRYDPLYSWSLSPSQLRRLQEERTETAAVGNPLGQTVPSVEKKDEQGEADRALTVVAKKLSKTLSVTATVNELIQQAADERNLALLFCGWAAYA